MQLFLNNLDDRKMEIAGIDMKMTMMWDRKTLRQKYDVDRASEQFYQSHRDLVAGYSLYVQDNLDDSRDIHPVNNDAELLPEPKALTDNISQKGQDFPHRLPLMTVT